MKDKGISVLIPTYNRPNLLRRALISVLNQTRLPDEIIISDDNPDSEDNYNSIEDILKNYSGLVRYEKNRVRLGVVGNYLKLLQKAKYSYIKFLADDDWLSPEALELMEKVLDTYDDVSLVTSVRLPVDIDGELIQGLEATKPLCEKDCILDGKKIINKSLIDLYNYVGEFSAYMFRKEFIDVNPFSFSGLDFRANADWFLWMYLLSKGNLFYIAKPLVFFTIHTVQDQYNLNTMLSGLRERLEFIFNKKLHSKIGLTFSLEEGALAVESFVKQLQTLPFNEKESLKKFFVKKYKSFLEYGEVYSWNKSLAESPSFSVIVVTYNSESTIEDLLISLKESISRKDEVIVIDNNSNDRTLQLVREFKNKYNFENLKIVSLSENLGYSAAVNKGVDLSRNDYIVFVNPDVVLPKNWKSKVLRYLKLKEVGAVGAISNSVLDQQHLSRFSSLSRLFNREDCKTFVDLVDNHLWLLYGDSYEEKKLLVGFFLATKKDVFKEVEGFDDKLFLGMDDLDFSLKLRERGYKLVLPKGLFVYHKGHESFNRSSDSEFLKKKTEHKFADKLIEKFGYGNVPTPEELWDEFNRFYFSPFVPVSRKYKFMFKYSDKPVDFVSGAKEILKKPRIGVVTVSYFSSVDIENLKKSLEKQGYENLFWYIVDHSQDEREFLKLKKIVRDYRFKISVEKRENKGYGAGVNYGIERALKDGCEYIWILNPDIELEANTLLELLKTLLYTGVPVVTCKIKDSVEREKLQYDGLKVNYIPFPDYPQRIHRVSFLSGANIFLSSSVAKLVRFSEDYFLYFEDNDFLEKLWRLGIQPLYTPYTHVYHKNKSGKFLMKPYEVYYFIRNRILFLKEKMNDFRILINDVMRSYEFYYSRKENLRALIEALYDAINGKYGKKEPIFTLPEGNSLDLLSAYFSKRRFTKSGALKEGRDYLLLKPRDKRVFYKFLRDVFTLLRYYGGKGCQRK